MNSNKRVKKLKTLNSLQTACTLEENVEGGFKINVISPRTLKRTSQLNGSTSIMEAPLQDELTASNIGMSRDMVAIPMLVNRLSNNSERKDFNTPSPKSEETSKLLLKPRQKEQHNQSVVHIQDSELFTSSSNSITSQKSKKNLQAILSVQKVDVKGNSIMLSQPVHQKKSGLLNSDHKKENQKDLPGKATRTEQQKQRELFRISIDHEQSVYIEPEDHCLVSVNLSSRLSPTSKKIEPIEEPPTKKSQKYEKLKQVRSHSRLKLRDYLYMAHTSRIRAGEEKRGMMQTKVSPIHAEEPKLLSRTTRNTNTGIKESESKRSLGQTDPRKNYINNKYKISNAQMFDILKREVCEDLGTLKSSISTIEQELSQIQVQDNQSSGDQLLILYNLRRQIKDHVSRRIQMAMDALQRSKANGKLKSRHKQEDVVLEEMSCSVFLEQNQS